MRHSAAEKLEIIGLVEGSELSVRRTLAELDIPRSTFYGGYRRYVQDGLDGLSDRRPRPGVRWNRIPESVRGDVLETALSHPDKSPSEFAWLKTDTQNYFISESSVYRILKRCDLITSLAYIVLLAGERFTHPTRRVNELWQTDFERHEALLNLAVVRDHRHASVAADAMKLRAA